MESSIAIAWLDLFEDRTVSVREVIDLAFSPINNNNPASLRYALTQIIPEIDPKSLSGWLKIVEGMPFSDGVNHYRFHRVGHSWRLVPALRRVVTAAA